jgi:DNA-binding SARP family transcriptional activator
MNFGILGPVEVGDEGGLMAVPGQRRRALLVRLLVGANGPIDGGLLAEDVWAGDPPPGVASTLQSHLSWLRGLLGPERIRGSSGSVIFSLAEGELDADCFETELRDGAEALRSGDPVTAAETLDKALGRWRGPALADVSGLEWALPEIVRLDELKTRALATRLDARLELGEHREIIAEAESLVLEHPMREDLAGRLMLALYRSGRQTDALAVYRRLRTTLGEELGLEPGSELRGLEESIVLQSPHLDLAEPHVARRLPARAAHGAAGPARIPLPAALQSRPTTGIVGRHRELEAIAQAAKRVSASDGRELVLISGEAGLGKTTLAAESARAAFAEGATVLFGHCEEDIATPYQLFAEALGQYVASAGADELAREAPAFADVSAIVPALPRRVAGLPDSKASDAETERHLLFGAVVQLLTAVSESQPIVLVFDDLQWADKASLQLLRHVMVDSRPKRVLVVGIFRGSELTSSHPLLDTLAALYRQQGVSRLELRGLDDEGVVALLENVAGHSLDEAGIGLAHAVYRETDGNPFFVTEVLRHLSDTGAIHQDVVGRWVSGDSPRALSLPESVRVVIGARLGRLGPTAERALSLAAVLGRDFDLDILVEATGTPESQLLDLLDQAAAASIVDEMADSPGRYSFTHALIQRTIVEELGPTRRTVAHRRIAEALESLCGGRPGARIGELARHWVATVQPRDLTKAIDYSRLAGEAALASLAPGDALQYFKQAGDLLVHLDDSHPELAIDIAIGLGTAQRQTGDSSYRETLLQAARQAAELDDTARLVSAALANDRGSGSGTIDTEKVEMLELALSRLPADHLDRALLLAVLCQELIFGESFDRCVALRSQALALARAAGDDAVILQVLNRGSFLAVQLLEDFLVLSDETMALAERLGDPVQKFWAATRRFSGYVCFGDMTEADRCLTICGELAAHIGDPALHWVHVNDLCTIALVRGDADVGEQYALQAMQIATDSGQPNPDLWFGGQIMTVAWMRGALGDLLPMIEQTAESYPGFSVFVAVQAHANAEKDDFDRARQLLAEFAATGYRLPADGLWMTGMMSYAEAAVECGLPEHAEAILEQMRPWAKRFSYFDGTTAGPVSHALGGLATVLGRFDEAEGYFKASVEQSRTMGAKFSAARTHLWWGQMLAQRARTEDSAEVASHLQAALEISQANGYRNVARRAEALIQSRKS